MQLDRYLLLLKALLFFSLLYIIFISIHSLLEAFLLKCSIVITYECASFGSVPDVGPQNSDIATDPQFAAGHKSGAS
jgi:hypothetical protein